MLILLIAILAGIPLLITPNLHLFFDVTPKVTLLLAAAAVSLPLVGFAAMRRLTSFRAGRLLLCVLLCQCVWIAVAFAFSVDRQLSMAGTNWRRFGVPEQIAMCILALSFAAWFTGGPRRIRLMLRTLALAGVVAAVYGILQYFGVDPWLPASGYRAGEGEWAIVRPPSTLGHASYFATWLLFPVACGAGLFGDGGEGRIWRGVGLCALGLGAAAIILSGTRAAIAGMGVGLAVLALRMGKRMLRRLLAGSALTAVALCVFYLSPAGELLRRRVHWISEDSRGGARLLLWRDSVAMTLHRPLAGYGPESFSLVFPKFQSADLSRAYPDFYHESPHNLFLDVVTQQGVPGAILITALLYLGIAAGFSTASNYATALTAGLLACLTSLQFTPLSVPVAACMYLSIAALVATGTKAPFVRMHSVLLEFALLFLALPIAWAGIRIWRADAFLKQATDSLQRGEVQTATAQFEKAVEWGARADLLYSRRAALAAQQARNPAQKLAAWQQAIAVAECATRTAEDRHNAYYNLAMFRAAENDALRTGQALRDAAAWSPNWFKPHWALARLLAREGKTAEALHEAETAVYLDASKSAEVLQTLNEIRARRSLQE